MISAFNDIKLCGGAGKLFLLGALLAAFSSTVSAQQEASGEYDIKAVFLYNFTRFVAWPSHTFTTRDEPFVIGILGEDPFQSLMEKIVAGEKVEGRQIVIRRYAHINEVRNCHILYISNKESRRMKDIVSSLKNRQILTVSDMPGFAVKGGMISFVVRDKKIKLEINPSVARTAGLSISSKLLRICDIVGE